MSALICGSLAFDTIMTFEGRFADQILPGQLHILNVSFLVPGLRRDSAAVLETSRTACACWEETRFPLPRWVPTARGTWRG